MWVAPTKGPLLTTLPFLSRAAGPDDIFLYSVVPFVIGGSQSFMIVRSYMFARALQDGPSSTSSVASSPRRGRARLVGWTRVWFALKILLCFCATTMGLMGTVIVAVGYKT